MRKPQLFSAVLSLFLLVPASITRAQVTKTLNGTVSYRSGLSETKFSTPNGNIKVSLPQSLSGSVISGTVSTEPAGKTEKEKSRNLKELMKLLVNLDGQKIPLSASPSNFDWLTHMDRNTRTVMELLNVSGAKIAEVSLPPVISSPVISDPGTLHLSLPSKILIRGDVLNVYTDRQFTSGKKFIITDLKGQQFTIKPICLSAQEAVLNVPDGVAPGYCKIRMEENEVGFETVTGATWFQLIDINLTSPNTNLKPGQQSYVEVHLNAGRAGEQGPVFANIDPKITEKDSAEAMQIPIMSFDLRNLNPNTVTMEGGNLQRVVVNGVNDADPDNEGITFRIKRNITGNAVGNFEVSATLHEDYNISNDPFRPQLNVLNTPEDFNAWINALRKDLQAFASLRFDDEAAVPPISYLQRAITNMPAAANAEQLDEAKAVAYSLLQPLHIPKGAAINWQSSYEAVKAVRNTMSNNEALVDFDVLQNGVEFINRVAQYYKETSLQTECGHVLEFIEQVQATGETKENLMQVRDQLNGLIKKADMKITADDHITLKTGMKDLIMSSYQLPSLAPPGRVHPFNDLVAYMDTRKGKLFVLPAYKNDILGMIGAQPLANGHYKVASMGKDQKPSGFEIAIQYMDQLEVFNAANDETEFKAADAEFTDSAGTKYKFYKDAECVVVQAPKKIDNCRPHEKFEYDPSTKEGKFVPDGKYYKWETFGISWCKKGKGFCVEMEQVLSIEYIYEDKECTRMIDTKINKGFKCQ